MKEWINEQVNNTSMTEWVHARMDGWIDGWMAGWMVGWMGEWLIKRMTDQRNDWPNECLIKWMNESVAQRGNKWMYKMSLWTVRTTYCHEAKGTKWSRAPSHTCGLTDCCYGSFTLKLCTAAWSGNTATKRSQSNKLSSVYRQKLDEILAVNKV